MYAPFDVPQLLGRPLEVSLTKESGLAGLIFLIKQHLGIELSKDDPRLLRCTTLSPGIRFGTADRHRMGKSCARWSTGCCSAECVAELASAHAKRVDDCFVGPLCISAQI